MTVSAAIPEVFRTLDLVGVFLNGLIGGELARQKRFDIVGVSVLAVMSALGGGMIRDVLLNVVPAALTDPYYLVTALLGAFVSLLWRFQDKWSARVIMIFDGVVLGVWAATGAAKTLSLGFAIVPAILLGMISAVGGGMIRDVFAGNIPMVFSANKLYATPAVIAASVMVFMARIGYPIWGMLAAAAVSLIFTLLAAWRKWRLPKTNEWTLVVTASQLRRLLRRAYSNRDMDKRKFHKNAYQVDSGERQDFSDYSSKN